MKQKIVKDYTIKSTVTTVIELLPKFNFTRITLKIIKIYHHMNSPFTGKQPQIIFFEKSHLYKKDKLIE